MNNEATQDRLVVLAVVVGLIVFAVGGLGLTAWLVHDGAEASSIAFITTPMAGALGALGAILARTGTAQAAVGAAQVVGYQKAVDDLDAIGAAAPAAPVEPLIPPGT